MRFGSRGRFLPRSSSSGMRRVAQLQVVTAQPGRSPTTILPPLWYQASCCSSAKTAMIRFCRSRSNPRGLRQVEKLAQYVHREVIGVAEFGALLQQVATPP